MRLVITALFVLVLSFPASAGERLALFPAELHSTSMEPVHQAELDRLKLVHAALSEHLEALGYELVATDAVADRVDSYAYLHDCNGCEARLAAEVGADVAGVIWVQKISNLILNVNLRLRDATSRDVIKVGSVDIRSNDDKSWVRGANYLIERRMFPKDKG